MKFIFRIFFTFYFAVFFSLILLSFLVPVFDASNISYSLGFKVINISGDHPVFWCNLKRTYLLTCFLSFIILINSLYSFLLLVFSSNKDFGDKKKNEISLEKNNELCVNIGENSKNNMVKIPILGLYQNLLITGSIGSGKTSSLLYPLSS